MTNRDDPLWRNLDWNLLRTFHEIAKHGGVSAAASALGRQQPAVSQALRRLEDQLGVELCHRGPAGFALTREGVTLLRVASDMVENTRGIRSAMNALSSGLRGVLRLAKMSGLSSPILDQSIDQFLSAHPSAEVFVSVLPWKAILSGIHDGSVDVGISYVQTVSVDLHHLPVFDERQMVFCGKRHAFYGKTFKDPSKLANHAFFVTDRDEPIELRNFRNRFELGAIPRGGSEDVTELARLISASTVLGFLPTQVAEGFGANLWPLLERSDLPNYPVYAVSRPSPYQSALASAYFLELQKALI